MDVSNKSKGALSDVWKQASQLTIPVIKSSWMAVLLIWAGTMLMIYADHIVLHPLAANITLSAIGCIAFLFFLGVLLLLAQSVVAGDALSFTSAVSRMGKHALFYFLTLVLLCALIFGYYFGGAWLVHHLTVSQAASGSQSKQAVMYFMMGVVAPLVVMVVFFLFALPLVVIEGCNPLRAFIRSYQLVGKQWVRAFSIYGMMGVVFILTSPTTLHAHFLMRYHVYPLFVLCIFLIFMPFICTLLVLMKESLSSAS